MSMLHCLLYRTKVKTSVKPQKGKFPFGDQIPWRHSYGDETTQTVWYIYLQVLCVDESIFQPLN